MPFPAMLVAGAVALTAVGGTAAAVVATAGESVVVERVVDGDTFDAISDGRTIRVRLLNVDTPETKDPSKPVECLGPEATARLEQLLPAGSSVTLDRDEETVDRYDRELAAVTNADGVFVNEVLAREGLGVPMTVGGNDRFAAEIAAANQEARAGQRGLYDSEAECTIPGAVAGVEALAMPGATQPLTPEQWEAQATNLDRIAGGARSVLAMFDAPRVGVVWAALSPSEQQNLRLRVQVVVDDATGDSGLARRNAAWQREQAAARQRAQEDAARQEAARQEEQRQVADRERAQAEADAREQRAAERRRASASDDSSSTRASGRSSGSSGAAGAYPGYNGPRCYAPGGRTWRPC
ncbi:thermonuclease family protein [Actinomycetospora aeridis]|uniref:Thermonuclease family protein n=1 Tax=Actinomycetospora aeridis TaxID=3129231 RepID=A0ABU8N3R1_9PSEU